MKFCPAAALAVLLVASGATDASADAASASIRGDRDQLLVVSTGTYVSGIDGEMTRPSPGRYEQPIDIAPGTHSLLVAFNANKFATLAMRFDAKPGGAYVIRWEQQSAAPGVTPPTQVWVEDEKSHDVVAPKRQIWPIDHNPSYVTPSGAGAATIGGSAQTDAHGPISVSLAAVDGAYTGTQDADAAKPLGVAPGLHALLIDYNSTLFGAEYPVLLDVKAAHDYVIGFTAKTSLITGVAPPHLSIWVDDTTAHERVLAEKIVPLKRLKFDTEATPPRVGKS
ncbi:MAG TPA: hypothetical protein VF449_05175 [Parvibaculum sp.]